MTRLKFVLAAGAAAAAVAAPITAFADSCANVSRPAPACGMDCTSPVVVGNWIWLPSLGIPFPAWDFAPPGTTVFSQFGLNTPDSHGNYQNIAKTSSGPVIAAWLLENSARCDPSKSFPNHQTTHGIQSGCGS